MNALSTALRIMASDLHELEQNWMWLFKNSVDETESLSISFYLERVAQIHVNILEALLVQGAAR